MLVISKLPPSVIRTSVEHGCQGGSNKRLLRVFRSVIYRFSLKYVDDTVQNHGLCRQNVSKYLYRIVITYMLGRIQGTLGVKAPWPKKIMPPLASGRLGVFDRQNAATITPDAWA